MRDGGTELGAVGATAAPPRRGNVNRQRHLPGRGGRTRAGANGHENVRMVRTSERVYVVTRVSQKWFSRVKCSRILCILQQNCRPPCQSNTMEAAV